MKVLAIDTAGWTPSVALWEDGQEIAFDERFEERNQVGLLPEMVKNVLNNEKIDLILVNVGPGSFTGIRLGLAFAKGLALGWNVPLKGLDSFSVTYLGIDSPSDVLILIESKRQDVYGKLYHNSLPQDPLCFTREDIDYMLSTLSPPLVMSSGVKTLLDGLLYTEKELHLKGARALAQAYFKSPHLFGDPLPFYVREADVTYPTQKCKSHP